MTTSAQNSFSTEMSSLLFEHTADPIFVLDIHGQFIAVNQAACDHTGYSREELLQMSPGHIDDETSRQLIPQRFAQLQQDRQATFDAVHIRKDGSHVPVEMHIRLVEHEGKTLTLNICRDVSQRYQKEFEYRNIVQTTTDGFWVASVIDARVLDTNDAYCRMLGYTRGEMLSMRIFDLEASESPEETSAHIEKVIATGSDLFETKHRHKDGHLIEIEISVSYSAIRGGVFYSFVRDVSVRKRYLRELVQSRGELELLYNQAPCGYHSLDADGRIARINQTEADWLGYSQEELIGRKITELQAPASAEFFIKDFARFKREGRIENVEVDLVRKDGSALNALLSSEAVFDADGNFVTNRTTLVDISKRKKVERELRVSEDRFRLLFEKSPIGIAMTTLDQQLFAANSAFCHLFGYSLDELCQLTVADLTHPDYIDTTEQLAEGVSSGKCPVFSFEKKYLRKGGEVFWGRVIATEIAAIGPQTRYLMAMVEDITDRVEREKLRMDEVRKQRDVLIREVHHRIKNNLQGVVGLLRQHVSEHPNMAEVVDVIIGRIYSIAIIHGLQAQEMSEEVGLSPLMNLIIDASGTAVEYHDDLTHSLMLSRDEAVPIALVLNELFTNAGKHRSQQSTVVVKLVERGSHAIITLSNSFDARLTDELKDGQGLSLVRSLLPRKSAILTMQEAEGVFTAELDLAPPVVIHKRVDTQ